MLLLLLTGSALLALVNTEQGSCPPTLAVDIHDAQCGPQKPCNTTQLCCPTWKGGAMCVDPVSRRHFTTLVKKGRCPSEPRGPWICSDSCTGDSDCVRKLKCCRNRCGALSCQKPELETDLSPITTTHLPVIPHKPAFVPLPNPETNIPNTENPVSNIGRPTSNMERPTFNPMDPFFPSASSYNSPFNSNRGNAPSANPFVFPNVPGPYEVRPAEPNPYPVRPSNTDSGLSGFYFTQPSSSNVGHAMPEFSEDNRGTQARRNNRMSWP